MTKAGTKYKQWSTSRVYSWTPLVFNIFQWQTILFCFFLPKSFVRLKRNFHKILTLWQATWFEENELVINPRKGKSEVMLFGTSQKTLQTKIITLSISFRALTINATSHYKYLGVD